MSGVLALASGLMPKLIAALTLAADYDGVHATLSCSTTLTFDKNGSWAMTSTGSLTGTPTTGRWAHVAGDCWEIQYVTSNLVNTPSISNGASSYSDLGAANRAITITKGSGVASADVTVNVRRKGTTTPVLTKVVNISSSGGGGGGVGVSPVGTVIP